MPIHPNLALARRINGERLVLLGWSRAILLQLAHPLVAAGVHDHSGFRDSPAASIRRLHGTTSAMLAIVFGDETQRTRAVEGIRAIHRRVNGTLREDVGRFPAGTPYSAEDPALLLWVHTTLIESTILAYERFVGSLTDDQRDQYCDACAPVACDLGAYPAEVPRTWHDLVGMNEAVLGTGIIRVGSQARELAGALLDGPLMHLLPPAHWFARLITVGTLPSPVRDAYGFSWPDGRNRTLARVSTAIRRTRAVTPDVIARFGVSRGQPRPR